MAAILVIAVLGYVVQLTLFVGVVPTGARAREAICVSSLRQIVLAVQAYTEDFGGSLPPSLSVLRDYGVDPESCSCPCAKNVAPGQRTYVYVRPAKTLGDIARPQDTIIAYDRPGNHPGGCHVVFLDGHVEWREGSVPPKPGETKTRKDLDQEAAK